MPKKTTTIRIDSEIHGAARERATELGFRSLSEYLEALMLIDAQNRPAFHTVRDSSGAHYYNSVGPTTDLGKKSAKKKNA